MRSSVKRMIVGAIPAISANFKSKEIRVASVLKICPKHGEVKHHLTNKKGNGHYRCSKCSNEAVQKRRDALKIMSVQYKGGKCFFCGYDKYVGALDFHHVNPSEKEFGISSGGNIKSFERLKPELDKCVLLCSNCHREVHAGLLKI